MSKNGLINTDSIWYKIKRFIRNIFGNKKEINSNQEEFAKKDNKVEENSIFKNSNTNRSKTEMARKIMKHEKDIYELDESELDDMIEYFTQYIQDTKTKIESTRKKIVKARERIESN